MKKRRKNSADLAREIVEANDRRLGGDIIDNNQEILERLEKIQPLDYD